MTGRIPEERSSAHAEDASAPRVRSDRRTTAALLLLWAILALTVAARRPDPAGSSALPDRPVAPLRIDLNRDPWPRLLLIEGIGEALARRIVVARDACGGFRDLDEVRAVPGVPDGAIDRARPYLFLGPRVGGAPVEGDVPPAPRTPASRGTEE